METVNILEATGTSAAAAAAAGRWIRLILTLLSTFHELNIYTPES